MPTEELPQLVLAGVDRIMRRDIGSTTEADWETDIWTQSSPIPGARIINTWQVFKGIWLVLTKNEAGHYQIFRTINMQQFTLVHDHATEIYNLFWLDSGHMLFCATNGWWKTTNTGITWSALDLGLSPPQARSIASIGLADGSWALVAYGNDHKIYYAEYPGGAWTESYDTTAIWSDKWYPAIAGGPVGVLAGAGSKLIRSTQAGAAGTWEVLQDVDGIIKSIIVSNQSRKPTFLITVEPTGREEDQIDKLYITTDMGDSFQEQANRVGAVSSVQSVIPTGRNESQTSFALAGSRVAGDPPVYRIFEVGG